MADWQFILILAGILGALLGEEVVRSNLKKKEKRNG